VRKTAAFLFASLLFSIATPVHADVAAIRADRLPQETAVLAALDDAREMEPYSHVWWPEWNFPLSKQDVAKHLSKDLDSLTHALKKHPENEELALLTGLVARYGYNVDVKGSLDATLSALTRARAIDSTDVRAPWFQATFMCETLQPAEGISEFLSLEASHAWDQLPAVFWIDYMECASHTNMFAHVLRAADHLEKLHGAATPLSNTYLNRARKRFEPFDPKKTYDPKIVWQSDYAGNDLLFTSTSCGLRLQARTDWRIDRLDLTEGSCLAVFSTGPYKAVTGGLSPSIMVLVQQAKEGETLEKFSKKFLTKGAFEPYMLTRCPEGYCMALKGKQPQMYEKDGGGHPRVVIFERDEPAFPGLIFEAPSEDPKPKKPGPFTFPRPNQIQQRIPGKLYYLVLLDTAASIEEHAMKDFDFFLENLTVE
jgi:hypothetical protein